MFCTKAPEVILGTGHGEGVDWWAVGVIMYEFLTGIPPFNDETPQQIFENILNGSIIWPEVPEEMSYEAQDLISKLLTINPEERLGSRKKGGGGGAQEVKNHPFFKGVEWDTLLHQQAVFIPNLKNQCDTSYFDGMSSVTSSFSCPVASLLLMLYGFFVFFVCRESQSV